MRIIVVEDVHWADTTTLGWLLTPAGEPAGGPAIAVSCRPGDVPALLRRRRHLAARPVRDLGDGHFRAILPSRDAEDTATSCR